MPENNNTKAQSGPLPGRHGPGGMGMQGPGEKPNDFKGTIRKLCLYGKQYIPIIIIAMCLALAGAILTVIGPNKLGNLTNEIQKNLFGQIDMGIITSIAVVLGIIYIASFAFSYTQNYVMATIAQRIAKRLRNDISEKINRIPLKYFDGRTFGDTLSRVTNDVDTLGTALNSSIGSIVSAAATFAGCLFMMFYTNWIMAVSGILASLLGFALMMIIMKKSQKYFSAQQKELGSINGLIEEVYSGHTVVKAYNGEKAASLTFHGKNRKLYDNAWKSQFMSGLMMPIMGFVGNFGYVVVCIVGAALVLNGSITIGTIVSFMLYIRLFTFPLSTLAQAATSLQSAAAAGERVFEFLEEEEMSDEASKTGKLDSIRGDVEFCNVRFGYNADRVIIKDFSAKIKAGQKVAIVGPTGAGKTTMVNLLMRFYEVNQGQILIDGRSIDDLTRENVHNLFCMVLQDTWMFEGTIRENIVYANKDVSEEQLIRACKAVGLHHFIKTLPEGYDTVLDDGASLSAGQKQLVTIARAMIQNAPLLILDEATSSVDTRTEKIIQEAMDKLTEGRTSFVIAHRLSTIKNADLILVMNDGDIVEAGNHEELLANGGFYAGLYNSQFEEAS